MFYRCKMKPRRFKGISARPQGFEVTLEGRRKPHLPDFWTSTASKGPWSLYALSLRWDPRQFSSRSIKSTFIAPSVTQPGYGRHTNSVTKLEEKLPCCCFWKWHHSQAIWSWQSCCCWKSVSAGAEQKSMISSFMVIWHFWELLANFIQFCTIRVY